MGKYIADIGVQDISRSGAVLNQEAAFPRCRSHFWTERVAMDQAPAVMLDHNKHVQQTKGRGHGQEEIARDDPPSV
jgi:hypothetical protein